MIEKMIEFGTLFDFYGRLLSERQYSIIESFYIHDLSLSEIAVELNISRQAVYDTLKRAEEKLFKFEKKLALVRKFNLNKEDIKKIMEYTDSIYQYFSDKDNSENLKIIEDLNMIKKIGLNILGNS